MNLNLDKSYIIRKWQDDESVSFRICFADEERNWMCVDLEVKKSEFKDITGLNAAAILMDIQRKCKSILQESPVEGETK